MEIGEALMRRAHSDRGRIELRLRPEAREEHLQLSERDSLRVLELLENPPAAPSRLVRAAKADRTLK
jgi:uncharacterized protein (DUF1778 family)